MADPTLLTVYYGTIEGIIEQINAASDALGVQGLTLTFVNLTVTGCRTPVAGGGGLTCLCLWNKK